MDKTTKEILEWLYCILIAIILALLVRHYLGTPTIVKQPSMYPTLKENQRLILSRLEKTRGKKPERGDIVTFEAPTKYYQATDADLNNPVAKYEKEPGGFLNRFKYYVLEIGKTSYIKRVIALEGEHITIYEGKVYIDGKLLDEPYLQPGVETKSLGGPFVDITVPEGYVFTMGDNREQSTDCRRFGCIPLEKVESKVLIRFWPLNLFGKIPTEAS